VSLLFPVASPGQPAGQDRPQQSSAGAQASPELRRRGVMDDVAQEIAGVREQMAKDSMTPESQREMGTRMKRLSEVMRRMSGLMDRPTMKEPEMAKQLDEMRKQMEALKKGHSMPAVPSKPESSKR
jgi:TolA-binding protein